MSKQLLDPQGRQITYLRLSLTDRCNLRCFYCLPKGAKNFTPPNHWLSFDEIERLVSAFAALGVARIRLTGGEPLVRPDATSLIARLTAIPDIDELSLSTNASLLSHYAQSLKEAGISRINVSLDTLKTERFTEITGGGELQPVLDGLAAAKRFGLQPIKINMVAMKGINDDEFADMVRYCDKNNFTLRLIETMPMGRSGQKASDHYMDLSTVRQQLADEFNMVPGVMPGGGPARYLQAVDGGLKVGFITPMSQHFCETCNRVRLSVDGVLYLCLGQEHSFDFKPLLRSGVSDETLQAAIIKALALKPAQHDFNQQPEKIVRFMSRLGG
ncbi:Cyclic pyranopterin phosphate synthase (MoaA) [hydrothermal vent metagenome]|uniref:GTP 3',8-cyclase n=1 Tax=hydrothermal vent metagenome TaxID=652676 RepID=A0A3B0ZBX0_9ZZZZ